MTASNDKGRVAAAQGAQQGQRNPESITDFKSLRVQPRMLWPRRYFLLAVFGFGLMDRRRASHSFVTDAMRAATARRTR